MRIVIIEDEKLTATNLAETILTVVPDARITAILSSVQSAVSWFQENEQPDLIFSDIQLGDGLCFDIFKTTSIHAPVIFCTAYDEYALKAFDANGIDYILKPFDKTTIAEAFQKYHQLKDSFTGNIANLEKIIQFIENKKKQSKGSVLVYKQDKIIPVRLEDIALFYVDNEITRLITFDHKTYTINKTLEKVEEISPDDFFRVNRQFLINHKAIKEASQYFGRKLSLTLTVPFTEKITVSKNKVAGFLNWLSNH
ncbi:MAG: response regulator transcription factor [Bacteroidales bacterium]|nr:response regulator transcription factor [Bacteroidales bacterium]